MNAAGFLKSCAGFACLMVLVGTIGCKKRTYNTELGGNLNTASITFAEPAGIKREEYNAVFVKYQQIPTGLNEEKSIEREADKLKAIQLPIGTYKFKMRLMLNDKKIAETLDTDEKCMPTEMALQKATKNEVIIKMCQAAQADPGDPAILPPDKVAIDPRPQVAEPRPDSVNPNPQVAEPVLAPRGKLILISDIDDTIKSTHVLDTRAALANSSRTALMFSGTSLLYRFLKADKIFYVSNAPSALMKAKHENFIFTNLFPSGTLKLRTIMEVFSNSVTDSVFKTPTIKQILKDENPDMVIFVGDNGEGDSGVYAGIEQEYKEKSIKFYTFIHEVYSIKKYPIKTGQIGFITAGELAIKLTGLGLMSQADASQVILSTLKPERDLSSKEFDSDIFLPLWMSCKEHIFEELPKEFSNDKAAKDFLAKSQTRCAKL